MKRLLKNASKRGVEVQIVLSSFSDVSIVKNATEYFYNDLLKCGIQLYEWKNSVLHAKTAIIDSDWFCLGSYNFNHLSDFGSMECNLETTDVNYIESIVPVFKNLIQTGCQQIIMADFYKKSSIKTRFIQFVSYYLVRISLWFLFFLQGKNSQKSRNKY